jgi:hypothetical protein
MPGQQTRVEVIARRRWAYSTIGFGEAPKLPFSPGEFHDQVEANRIVIRRPLRGHNNTPCRRSTNSRPIGRPRAGCPQDVFNVFSYF